MEQVWFATGLWPIPASLATLRSRYLGGGHGADDELHSRARRPPHDPISTLVFKGSG
jgi:hypothetical protein